MSRLRRLARRLSALRLDPDARSGPGGRAYTLDPPAAHAYACGLCKRWHREDREPKLYREHCCHQVGAVTYTVPVAITA